MQKQAVIEAVQQRAADHYRRPRYRKDHHHQYAIIRYFESEGLEILLAAPTGRAAKRMTEATGCEAKTIHRLLEMTGAPGERMAAARKRFERNEENPLDADVIIIDEMSMVDIHLMHALLEGGQRRNHG